MWHVQKSTIWSQYLVHSHNVTYRIMKLDDAEVHHTIMPANLYIKPLIVNLSLDTFSLFNSSKNCKHEPVWKCLNLSFHLSVMWIMKLLLSWDHLVHFMLNVNIPLCVCAEVCLCNVYHKVTFCLCKSCLCFFIWV